MKERRTDKVIVEFEQMARFLSGKECPKGCGGILVLSYSWPMTPENTQLKCGTCQTQVNLKDLKLIVDYQP